MSELENHYQKIRSNNKEKLKINVKMPHLKKTTREKKKFGSNKKMDWENDLEKSDSKIWQLVKIGVKLPHVNKT